MPDPMTAPAFFCTRFDLLFVFIFRIHKGRSARGEDVLSRPKRESFNARLKCNP